ncbi:F-box protein CPR1-like [Papaver somniferum]|uniref:F-box protein CPR1-like n=1 Tax=Papaver somniferum TaxID=3469 RepID=UPI000E6F920A|nr:F-box protein CPR1-like [Papaver somniferum]
MYYSVGYASILTASASLSSTTCKCAGAVLMDNPVKENNRGGVCAFVNGAPRGLLNNGALHWPWATATGGIRKHIVAFDISNEKFRILPFPEDVMLRPNNRCKLRVLGDSLCLVCLVPGLPVDVWVMQNYGVRESWTKKFTSTQFLQPSLANWSLKNGEILIQLQLDFALYDQKKNRIRILEFNGIDRFNYLLQSESYMESLVPLYSGTYTTS